jgi:HK97 family phage major capsid protein
VQVEKAQAFIPFSIEVGEDWPGMRDELARLLADSKDTLEADKFMNGAGHGSTEPQGLLTGATTVVDTSASGAFAVGDLYTVAGALPARYRDNATWLANFAIFSAIRGFDTSGGAALWTQLGSDNPSLLLGKPAYEASYMGSTKAAGDKIAVLGDCRYFAIVDRVGLNVELVPHLFGATRRPIGARALYAYWRNSSGVLVPDAFRVLRVKP